MMAIPVLDLSLALDEDQRPQLLADLRDALFNIGFLYVKNHGIDADVVSNLADRLPALFDLPAASKLALSKINSPHFLGYNGFGEEKTAGRQDLREQFDFATELPVIWDPDHKPAPGAPTDFSQPYWRLRGPNQWPSETALPGFRKALTDYHDAVARVAYDFVHLLEAAFAIPKGTFDSFFRHGGAFVPPQHRIKLLKYYAPLAPDDGGEAGQGVGPHADTSGWLTFLLQASGPPGLDVLAPDGETWLPAPPVAGTLVVNFGKAMEAVTGGAVRATVHRVRAPGEGGAVRYSVPFFMGLPVEAGVRDVWERMPRGVREARGVGAVDGRWECFGEGMLAKWIGSHRDVGRKWYSEEVVERYSG